MRKSPPSIASRIHSGRLVLWYLLLVMKDSKFWYDWQGACFSPYKLFLNQHSMWGGSLSLMGYLLSPFDAVVSSSTFSVEWDSVPCLTSSPCSSVGSRVFQVFNQLTRFDLILIESTSV